MKNSQGNGKTGKQSGSKMQAASREPGREKEKLLGLYQRYTKRIDSGMQENLLRMIYE